MAWLTLTVKRLDEAERRGRAEAAQEEKVRLALWRMESQIAPLVARESLQPPDAYRPSRAAGLATRLPSSPYVRQRFEWDAAGRASSPAVGASIDRAALEARVRAEWVLVHPPTAPASASDPASRAAIGQLAEGEDEPSPAAPTPDRESRRRREAARQFEAKQAEAQQRIEVKAKDASAANAVASPRKEGVSGKTALEQRTLSKLEFLARASNAASIEAPAAAPARPVSTAAAEVRIGRLQPVFLGAELVLARRVSVGSQELLQVCWLDWPALQRWMLAGVADLLPGAELVPVGAGDKDETRRLAALPVRLLPGATAAVEPSGDSALRLPVAVAWALAFVALAASGALLFGMATLGERRAAFVSAVTHELRTPLTTFRMYSDMLLDGMVASDEQRREYLATLSREAERQCHLVENVLAYSRLERGRYAGSHEDVTVEELLASVCESLTAHAGQSSMSLVTSVASGSGQVRLRVDRSAVERILFNLVDNACKYARVASDRRIHVDVESDERVVRLTVSDHGPGIDSREARRLFRPFHKSAREAAQSAPGVGLGLALSRRLARALGGDLRVVRDHPYGAAFCVTLPRDAG
jgi:signal transduction histidine kinase